MIWRGVKKKLTQNSSTEKQLKRKEERYQGYLEKLLKFQKSNEGKGRRSI